ncbi:MAG TPA: hypothetical protein VGL59_04670 [Polyangia bacterium]|jgi:hypothetical protein
MMKTKRVFWISLAALLVFGLEIKSAEAQISQSRITTVSLPPAIPYNLDLFVSGPAGTTFNNVIHDYALHFSDQDPNDLANVAYARYTAPAGSSVVLYPQWPNYGPDQVPAPTANGDDCAHAHFGFAVYSKVTIFNGSNWITYYSLRATQGEVGRRYAPAPNGGVEVPFSTPGASCRVSSEPEVLYPAVYNQFIWSMGTIATTGPLLFNFLNTPNAKVTEAIVVAQSATHGWGNCGYFQCYMGVGLIAQMR